MSRNDPTRLRAIVLSVVKHDYIARAVAAHPRFELVAVTDDAFQPEWVHERNREFAQEFGLPYEADLDRTLAECGAEVAIVSSQAERHCELAARAAEAGMHLIVDKPLSTRLEDCRELVETIARKGVRCLVWNRNFFPALLQAREVVQRGEIGELCAIHCDFYFAKDAGEPKGSRGKDDPAIDWLQHQIAAHVDGSDGGVGEEAMGELQVEGIYPLAYLRMLTGGLRVEGVFARTASHFHQVHVDNEVEDLASVTLEMEGGVMGSICVGRIGAASHPDLGEIKLHLLGTKGALVISEPRPEVAVYHRGQPASEFRHERLANENDFLLLEDFLHAIESGGETILDAQGACDICAVVVAALASAKSNVREEVAY